MKNLNSVISYLETELTDLPLKSKKYKMLKAAIKAMMELQQYRELGTLQQQREKKYVEITEAEAKELYCKDEKVYICNDKRNYWKLPASYEYSSHAPAGDLFYRSIPKYEGNTKFYK